MKLTRAACATELETLGVDLAKVLPVPKFDSSQFPEVKRLLDLGLHREQYTFRMDGTTMEKIFSGPSPFNDGITLTTLTEPRESYPIPEAPERREEFAPGLDEEMQALADAFTEFKESGGKVKKNVAVKGTKKKLF